MRKKNAEITTGGSVVAPPVAPVQTFGPSAPGSTNVYASPSAVASAPVPGAPSVVDRQRRRNLIETIAIVILSLIAVLFIGLFIWKYMEWDTVKTDVDGQVDAAVAEAVSANETKMEQEFAEREKYPYRTFTGPVDYGSLSFEFPKTWNVYIASDASNGGDFAAYLNPSEVYAVSSTTINALRVTITNTPFDNAVKSFESALKNGSMTVETRPIGNSVENIYRGELSKGMRGAVTLIKIRDKTVYLQTDAEIFLEEYEKLLQTVTFVE